MSLKIAYLINQYPKVSHSFIRREILALEAQGIQVLRFAIRACAAELVDEADRQELEKTRLLLGKGVKGLLTGLLKVAIGRPGQFWQALRLALRVGWRSEQGLLLHLAYLAEACVLLGWLQAAEVAHVHAHFGTNSTTVAMLCQALGGPSYSFTVHGPEEFDKVNAIALPEKISRAAFVVAISSYGRSQLYRWCSAEQWGKIQVVRCGVEDEFLSAPPHPIPDVPQLVCVGRLCEQKGQLLLVKAARQLATEGLPFKLVLVGDGPLRSEIEAMIQRYGLTQQVEITGWASGTQVQQHLLASRAMVLPSFAEGLPVVIMEALALHRPVISTYVAGIPELVQPACGWLVSPGSIEALVDAIRLVLKTPVSQLEQMGAVGARQVAQQHNIKIEAEHLAELFHLSLEQAKVSAQLLPVDRLLAASGTSKAP